MATWNQRIKCEFCGLKVCVSPDDTVCGKCDAQMKRDDEAAFAKLKLTAVARRCRSCRKPLGADRYYKCEACSPECLRSSDGDYHVEIQSAPVIAMPGRMGWSI
jgi:hypothetical protein